MELSWELEQLTRTAAPDVILHGHRLLHRVSDVVQRDGGSIEALVRGEVGQVVSLDDPHFRGDSSCTCGAPASNAACAHVIAVRLRALQLFHGLNDDRLARWERRAESYRLLAEAWGRLADGWLEATEAGDDDASAALFRHVESVEGGMQIAHALAERASSDQFSAYLVQLASTRGIDGRLPLNAQERNDAYELTGRLGRLLSAPHPQAFTEVLLAIAESLRRTVTTPSEYWRARDALTYCCAELGDLLTGGFADSAEVGGALLRAELDAPASDHPWIALVFLALGSGARGVAQEMRARLEHSEYRPGAERTENQWLRVRAEIGFASEGMDGLLPVLEEWADAPYGEFLCRLPGSWAPTHRRRLIESAHRQGRVRWSPGWPRHVPWLGQSVGRHQIIHESLPHHPMWSDIAIGDVVVEMASNGREAEAREALIDHSRKSPSAEHRSEFIRIWDAARLGEGAEARAAEIFGDEDSDFDDLLSAIARIPEDYFNSDLSEIRQGISGVLLTAVLFEDISREHAHRQDSSVWASSLFSSFPGASDDLGALAEVPAEGFAMHFDRVCRDSDNGRRVQRITQQLSADGCSMRTLADARASGEKRVVQALESASNAGPLTAGLVALILWSSTTAAVEKTLATLLQTVTGRTPEAVIRTLERAYQAEPRGDDFTVFLLALLSVELDGHAGRLRTR